MFFNTRTDKDSIYQQTTTSMPPPPRLYKLDVKQFRTVIPINGRQHYSQMSMTGFGGKLLRLQDMVVSTYNGDLKSPQRIYPKIFKDCPALHHGERQLIDHIQVYFSIIPNCYMNEY